MEESSQLLLLFYRKIIAQHPHKTTFIRRLHSLLKQIQMTQQHAQDPPTHKNRSENQNTIPDKLTEAEASILKRASQEWGLQCAFVAHSFLQNMLFAVLNHFIELEDFLGFKCLEQKLNMRLQECDLADDTMRVISYEWFRMGRILLNKNRLRWQKLLSETVHSMPAQFDALFGQVWQGDGPRQSRNQHILSKISKLVKAKIIYFQLQGRRMLNRQTFGMGQSQIYVCFLHDLSKHLTCNKPPQQTLATKQKEQTLTEMRLAFDSLIQQYEQDTANMTSLSNLTDLRLNEWKVTAYLGKK